MKRFFVLVLILLCSPSFAQSGKAGAALKEAREKLFYYKPSTATPTGSLATGTLWWDANLNKLRCFQYGQWDTVLFASGAQTLTVPVVLADNSSKLLVAASSNANNPLGIASFSVETYDPNGYFNGVATFTAPSTGYYRFSGNILGGGSPQKVLVAIYKNGVLVEGSEFYFNEVFASVKTGYTFIIGMTAGDGAYIFSSHTGGSGNLNLSGSTLRVELVESR